MHNWCKVVLWGSRGADYKISKWVRRGVRVGRSYLDKDTHTWRWWPRRVVTRILQPADTGQEEADMMGEEEEVQEKKKKVKKEEETR